MTINEVAETLTRCAEDKCDECKYHEYSYMFCKQELVIEMGAEVRKIAEEMEEQK